MADEPDLGALLRKLEAEQRARTRRRRRAGRLLTGGLLVDVLVVDGAGNVLVTDDGLLLIP